MTPFANPAIFFHPDQIEGNGKDLVGRRSAGQSFLKGFLRHNPASVIEAVTETKEAGSTLEAVVRQLGETRPLNVVPLRGGADFTGPGTVFFPTPGFQRAPWLRQRWGQASCSLVGITHTMSTRRAIEGLHQLMSEPVHDWDAIICTSRAVHSVVARQLDLEADFVRERFGATRVPQPRLPVIPLGIAADDFAPLPDARDRLRAAYGVPENGVVIMTMGRLSVVEKANPLPLFIALELLAQQLKVPIHLWIVGWASRPEEEALHREGAAVIARSVKTRLIDGRDADVRRNIWAAADIFTLPADSIQETFGLVPVEAMAAGLPVVMPDWDGFRDTVLHRRTGLLVPTRMGPRGFGEGIARRFADETDGYLQYLALVQSHVQIDVPAYAQALGALVENGAARKQLGAQAAAHVRANLDWKAIIPQYLALAGELADRRAASQTASQTPRKGPISPIEVDPFDLYADYPTEPLSPDTPLSVGLQATPEVLALFDRLSGRELYKRRAFDPALGVDVQRRVSSGTEASPMTPARLAREMGIGLGSVMSVVLTLAKGDLLRLPRQQPREKPPVQPPLQSLGQLPGQSGAPIEGKDAHLP